MHPYFSSASCLRSIMHRFCSGPRRWYKQWMDRHHESRLFCLCVRLQDQTGKLEWESIIMIPKWGHEEKSLFLITWSFTSAGGENRYTKSVRGLFFFSFLLFFLAFFCLGFGQKQKPCMAASRCITDAWRDCYRTFQTTLQNSFLSREERRCIH